MASNSKIKMDPSVRWDDGKSSESSNNSGHDTETMTTLSPSYDPTQFETSLSFRTQ